MAHICGPFRVITALGKDITPRGQIGRAMLAVILCSPDQTCTKQSLIDMFWATSDQHKARASLRSALSALRRDLSSLGNEILVGDSYSIRIKDRNLSAAPRTRQPFLQDIDIGSSGADGFEVWLRSQRQSIATTIDSSQDRHLTPDFSPNNIQILETTNRALGVLPCRLDHQYAAYQHAADHLIDIFLHALIGTVDVKVFDYREQIGLRHTKGLDWTYGNGPALMVRPHIDSECSTLTLQVLDSRSQVAVLKGVVKCSLKSTEAGLLHVSEPEIVRCVEQTIEIIDQSFGNEAEILSPYQALISMFRLKPESLDKVQAQVLTSLAIADRPYLHGVNCYLRTVRIGEDYSTGDDLDHGTLLEMTRKAIEPDPFQAFNFAMAGFTLSYVLGEKDIGADLTKRATQMAPDQAFCWDQHALCLFCLGAFEPAYQAALKAQTLGAYSPIRYTYDTTAAIISFARGDYASTIKFGNRAIFRMPKFTSALKYTAAALGHINQLDDSRRLGHQMRIIGRMTSLSDAVSFVGLPNEDSFKERLTAGLKLAGVN